MRKIIASFLLVISSTFASITIDGSLTEWKPSQKINIPNNLPLNIATGDFVYSEYSSINSTYYFALDTQDTNTQINTNTTVWLNTDKNEDTGYQIFGGLLGAEYYINIAEDGLPYLYSTEPYGTFVYGPLTHSYNSAKTVLEFSIPSSLIGSVQNDLELLIDINDSTYIPSNYFAEPLTALAKDFKSPIRTDLTKKVAVVYSESTKNQFYDKDLSIQKAYSQLFMTMQYQSMMAGVPFELLSEDDLTDISKLVNYDTIIFPSFAYHKQENSQLIKKTLLQAVYDYNIGIITAGDLMTNYEDGTATSGDSYSTMKQILGVGRVDGNGPVTLTLNAGETTHLAMKGYTTGETILDYTSIPNRWYSYYEGATNGTVKQETTSLATQTINGTTSYDAVLASTTGGRNVHFSSLAFMGDSNLLWSAIQWSVYGNDQVVSLKLGRNESLFVSRNDMDQSSVIEEVQNVETPLLGLLQNWKNRYNFVGSYYINIGNNPPEYQTNWSYSQPIYKQFIALGNEIGTHSNTHPHDTNDSSVDIQFEFNNSMDIIGSYLNPTWQGENIRGGAVPGTPEDVEVAQNILQYLDYLTGGYSGAGRGYPNSFGYLTPDDTKVYLSPNMSFDFTLMEFGIPVYNTETETYYPQPLSASEALKYWEDEFKTITAHASTPIAHWPWHDYGPTTSTQLANPYSVEMFTNTIRLAYNSGAEFVTAIDLAQRIETFKNSKITIENLGSEVKVIVDSNDAGKLAIEIPGNQKIKNVTNWYAYNDNKVFLDKDAGEFNVELGTTTDDVTHISTLPMRSELISLNGDGDLLDFTIKGEGKIRIKLKNSYSYYKFSGADYASKISDSEVELTLNSFNTYNIKLTKKPEPVISFINWWFNSWFSWWR